MRISRLKRAGLGLSLSLGVLNGLGVGSLPAASAVVPPSIVLGSSNPMFEPMATKNGRYLVIAKEDRSIVSIDATTGVTTTIAGVNEGWTDVKLADSATPRVVWGTSDGRLLSRSLSGGAVVDLSATRPSGTIAGLPDVSPDGRYLAWFTATIGTFLPASIWLAPVGGPAPSTPVALGTVSVVTGKYFTGDSSALVWYDSSTSTGSIRSAPTAGGAVRTLVSSAYGDVSVVPGDGDRVSYRTVSTAAPNLVDLWTVHADGTGMVAVATGISQSHGAQFSPDGNTVVVSQTAGGPVWIGPSSGGPLHQLAPQALRFYNIWFSSDSSRIVLTATDPSGGAAPTMTSFDRTGGDPVALPAAGHGVVGPAADARYFITSSGDVHLRTFERVDLLTGALTPLAAIPLPSSGWVFGELSADRHSVVAAQQAPVPDSGDVVTRISIATGQTTVLGPLVSGVVRTVLPLQGGRTAYTDRAPQCPNGCTIDVRLAGPVLPTPPITPINPPNPNPTTPSGTTPAPVFQSVANPSRVLNTRDGTGTALTQLRPGEILELAVAGVGEVPASASAVALNVTAVDPIDAGYLTVWPCGTEAPTASNLNFAARQTVPNSVITKIGVGGKVCFATSATTGLIADLAGWYGAGSAYRPLVPERLLETRREAGQVGYSGDKPVARQVVVLQVTGVGASNVPADADAVVLNVTGVGATDDGYLTVWPCGSEMPTASSLNLTAGSTRANLVVSRVGAGGTVCIFTDRGTDLLADVAGYFPKASGLTSVSPVRLLDTRPATRTGYAGDQPVAGDVVRVKVTGPSAALDTASAVVLNVTGVGATAAGYVTVWPCGSDRPDASNLNLEPGVDAPNLAIAKVGTNGEVCLFTERGAHLLVDLAGWL